MGLTDDDPGRCVDDLHPTRLEGAYLIDVERHADERGFLARTFCEREFAEHGLPMRVVQSSTIHSPRRHTLRGLHYQEAPHAEIKLVRCTRGSIFLVMVDLRPGSRDAQRMARRRAERAERAARVRARGVRAGLPDPRGRHRGPLPDVAPLRAGGRARRALGRPRRSASTGPPPRSGSSPSAIGPGPISASERHGVPTPTGLHHLRLQRPGRPAALPRPLDRGTLR